MANRNGSTGPQPAGFLALGAILFFVGMAVGQGGEPELGILVSVVGAGSALIGIIALGVRVGRRD